MVFEPDGAFSALVEDECVVVSWSYRQSETVLRDQTAGRPPSGRPAHRGDRNRCIRLPWIWDGGINPRGYRLLQCEQQDRPPTIQLRVCVTPAGGAARDVGSPVSTVAGCSEHTTRPSKGGQGSAVDAATGTVAKRSRRSWSAGDRIHRTLPLGACRNRASIGTRSRRKPGVGSNRVRRRDGVAPGRSRFWRIARPGQRRARPCFRFAPRMSALLLSPRAALSRLPGRSSRSSSGPAARLSGRRVLAICLALRQSE